MPQRQNIQRQNQNFPRDTSNRSDNERPLPQRQQQQQRPNQSNYQRDDNNINANFARQHNEAPMPMPQRELMNIRNENPLPQRQNQRPNQAREPRENSVNEEEGAGSTRAKTEEEIKRDRRWKNDNKAKIAHHNRKDLAAKKSGSFY